MPAKPRTRKPARKLASVPTQAEANAVADTIAAAAAQLVEAPVVIDRGALRAAKVKADCESDYRVQAVLAHAQANYETEGWDVVLETMTVIDIYWVVYKARSSSGAIRAMAAQVAPYAAHRDEIVNA